MASRWHVDVTQYDLATKMGDPRSLLDFYCDSIEELRAAKTQELLAEYYYLRYGRPRWFVSTEMTDLLQDITIDDDLSNMFLPYDSLTFVFERGTQVGGRPLRFVRISIPRADITDRMFRDLLFNGMPKQQVVIMEEQFRANSAKAMNVLVGENGFTIQADFGEKADGSFDEDTSKEETVTSHWSRLVQMPLPASLNTAVDPSIMDQVTKIVVSAFLYYNARPEFVRDITLPRSERYQQIGDRGSCKEVLLPFDAEGSGRPMPTVKHLQVEGIGSGTSGASKRHHYRGWVLRTLRNERYQRNPDGTFKTTLVAPCEINPEPGEEANL